MSSRFILVTGATQGLGFGIIELAAERGPQDRYILCSRDLSRGLKARSSLYELGVPAETVIDVVQLDVEKNEDVVEVAAYVERVYGRLDVLVNNAGFGTAPDAADLAATRAEFNAMFNTNVASVAVVTYALLPLLRRSSDPKVINITSGQASMTKALADPSHFFYYLPGYATSKIALNGLTVHMQAGETLHKQDGSAIRFYVVSPGLVKTALTRFIERGKSPKEGAVPVVEIMQDTDNLYPGGTQWVMIGGEMTEVPW